VEKRRNSRTDGAWQWAARRSEAARLARGAPISGAIGRFQRVARQFSAASRAPAQWRMAAQTSACGPSLKMGNCLDTRSSFN